MAHDDVITTHVVSGTRMLLDGLIVGLVNKKNMAETELDPIMHLNDGRRDMLALRCQSTVQCWQLELQSAETGAQ